MLRKAILDQGVGLSDPYDNRRVKQGESIIPILHIQLSATQRQKSHNTLIVIDRQGSL